MAETDLDPPYVVFCTDTTVERNIKLFWREGAWRVHVPTVERSFDALGVRLEPSHSLLGADSSGFSIRTFSPGRPVRVSLDPLEPAASHGPAPTSPVVHCPMDHAAAAASSTATRPAAPQSSLLTKRPRDVPPPNAYEGRLYGRLEPARLIFRELVRTRGQTSALLLDQCPGVGKTTVCHGFRDLYAELRGELEALVASDVAQQAKLHALLGAVYVHVALVPNSLENVGPTIAELLGQCVAKALRASTDAMLEEAVAQSPPGLARWLARYYPGVSFILHFDGVGALEGRPEALQARNDIGALWNYAADLSQHALLDGSHVFYLFSGRSGMLHSVCKGLKRAGLASPGIGLLVTLNALTREDCADILQARNLRGWASGRAFEWFYKPEDSDEQFHRFFLSPDIVGPVMRYSPFLFMPPEGACKDVRVQQQLEALLLLSVSRIAIDLDQDELLGEPLSAVMSRLGFHSATAGGITHVACSRYRAVCLGYKHAAIIYDSDGGNRLELGGFHVAGLRADMRPRARCWADYGTRPTEEHLSHMEEYMEWCCQTEEADDFFGFTHPEGVLQTFPHSCTPQMLRKLVVGQLHRSVSEWCAGDAAAKIGESDILIVEYKNERKPMSLDSARAEAHKVKATGFSIWLVIAPLSGHSISQADPNRDWWFSVDNAQVLVLCKKSVNDLLGVSLVSAINGTALATDGIFRLTIMYTRKTGTVVMCGGSLIAPTWVLTAGHCIDWGSTHLERPLQQGIKIVVGHLTPFESPLPSSVKTATIASVYAHPDFDLEVVLNDPDLPDGAKVWSIGWGAVYTGGPESPVLMEVKMPIIDRGRCKWLYNWTTILDSQLCTVYKEGGRNNCNGDSGSPIVYFDKDGNAMQVGITSWGSGAGCSWPGDPSVSTRVSSFRGWIDSTMAAVDNGTKVCGECLDVLKV
eukprot:m51a1_g5008 hypothetical protein (924) ;mRNA; f:246344-252509